MAKAKDWKADLQKVLSEYNTLAMRANKRMLRLERYSDPSHPMYRPEAKHAKQWAYKKAQRNIQDVYGPDATRWREKVKLKPETQKEARDLFYHIKGILNQVQGFLSSATSTLSGGEGSKGIRKVYDNRTNTINERYLAPYGEEFTPQELAKFFQSKKQAKLQTDVGSDFMYVVAAKLKKQPTSKKDIREYLQDHIDINEITEADLEALDLESKEELLDQIENGNHIAELRKLMAFVQTHDDPVLRDKLLSALDAGITNRNIFKS